MTCDLVFESNQFNLSQVHSHFINPCCFGEDLAAWLRQHLREQGIEATVPGQEDWGWYIYAQFNEASYFIGIGGNSNENPTDLNEGEWRFMIQKERSLWQRLTTRDAFSRAERIVEIIEQLLIQKLDVESVRYEMVQ